MIKILHILLLLTGAAFWLYWIVIWIAELVGFLWNKIEVPWKKIWYRTYLFQYYEWKKFHRNFWDKGLEDLGTLQRFRKVQKGSERC